MQNKIKENVISILKKNKYLKKDEHFEFSNIERVKFESYKNDLYEEKGNQNVVSVDVLWGKIKHRFSYCEVYLSFLPEKAYLVVINNGKKEIELQISEVGTIKFLDGIESNSNQVTGNCK